MRLAGLLDKYGFGVISSDGQRSGCFQLNCALLP